MPISITVSFNDQEKPLIEATDEYHNVLFLIDAADLTIEKLAAEIW